MDLQGIRRRLQAGNYEISSEDRLPNDTGDQLRLSNGAIVNVYDSGKVVVQGKNKEPLQQLLEFEFTLAGTIFWSDEDDVFVAEVPELPGCMAHGSSHEEALRSAQDAVALWLESASELGRAIPKPKGRRLAYA